MPINIPHQLPAREVLERENIFVMDADRARMQDIRPLNILILNLMPEKEKTEAHLLRLLGNTPLQVNVSFLYTATYESKNVSKSHLEQFYITLEEAKSRRYDGLIITGAPIELMEFEAVSYWPELQDVMDWAKTNVTSTLHICWGAQAALYHHYGIGKFELPKKCSGVFAHTITDPTIKLLRGFDDEFYSPVSRYTDVSREAIEANDDLILLASSQEAGPLLVMSKDARNIMITGHLEYDAFTLAEEYDRDCLKGVEVEVPENYFPGNNPDKRPLNKWRSHAHLLYSNWLNYYVYQETPYEWK